MIFVGAADCETPCLRRPKRIVLIDVVVMILRVWALYGRSRVILGALLTFYAIEGIAYLVCCVMECIHDGSLGMQNIASHPANYIT